MKYKFVGLDLAPFPQNQSVEAGLFRDPQAWRKTARRVGQPPGAVPVFADETGKTVASIPELSSRPVPWIAGDEQGPAVGLLPATKLGDLAKSAKPAGSSEASKLVASKILEAAQAAQKENNAAQTATAQTSPVAPVDPSLEDDLRKQAPQIAAGAAFGAAAGILNDLGGGSHFAPASMAGGLAGGIISEAAYFAYKKLQPDPDASTARWAAFMAGPKVLNAIFSSGEFSKLWGAPGPYSSPALRVGDADEAGNKIISGCPTVIIEGMPAARVNDTVEAAGVSVQHGALKVNIGAQCAGRTYGAKGWGSKSAAGKFLIGAPRTLIGGPRTFNVKTKDFPPIPDEVSDASAKVKGSNGLPAPFEGVADSSNPDFPRTSGIYFDTDSGEYRIWDAIGSKGWSSALGELSNLNGSFVWSLLFKDEDGPSLLNQALQAFHLAGEEETGHWYALGGMWDLGSPELPGAGTGSTWFIPDSMWGISMSPFYQFHDWIYPASGQYRTNTGWWDQIVNVEWPAYLEGAAGQRSNPFGQFFQIIYSTATTITGVVSWSNP